MARKRLGEMLIEAGVLDEAGLRAALTEQKRWGGPLGRFLIEMNLVAEDVLVAALAAQMNFPTVDLDAVKKLPAEVIAMVPVDLAERYSMIPLRFDKSFLDVAMSDPTNLGILDELRIRTHLNVRPYLVGPRAIDRALGRFYGRGINVFGGPHQGGTPTAHFDGNELELEQPSTAAARPQRPPRSSPQVLADGPPPATAGLANEEVRALQARVSTLEGIMRRDEDVLRKLMVLLIEKGITTREEILERIQ